MQNKHNQALVLAAIPALALASGLIAFLFSQQWLIPWIFAAGIVPVLATLLVSIVQSLMRGEFGLDIIAALSMVGALLAGENLAGAVVALMYSGGMLLEDYAQGRAQHEMSALLSRIARSAPVYHAGGLVDTLIKDIKPGDRILIRAGDVVPNDGHIASGPAMLDESSLTGEAMPVQRIVGAEVASGVTNAGEPFDMMVTKLAAESTYAGIVRLVDAARLSKAPMARLADQHALGFLALTLTLAGGAWFFTGDPKRALAVLVVATPCPLILAVPVAIVSGMSRAAKRGLLFKSARVLEILPQIKTLLIDKTGTLTDGHPRIAKIELRKGFGEDAFLVAAASLAQASQHVISQALVSAAQFRHLTLVPPTKVVDAAGDGLSGFVGKSRLTIGRPSFVAAYSKERTQKETNAAAGTTVLAVAINGKPAGQIIFADHLRDNAGETLKTLRAGGIGRVVLLTGDQKSIGDDIGNQLAVDHVIAEATPEAKVKAVRAENLLGPTMMVGDGINDAPALAAADIGVAMGARGAAAAAEAADIVLLVDDIDRIAEAMSIARRTRAIALQSVLVGLSLSSTGMVAAALGYLPPLAGAILQEAIDVAVILNALRALGPGNRTEIIKTLPVNKGKMISMFKPS